MQAAEPQVQPERPGPPCAMALRFIRSLPGDRLVCHRGDNARITHVARTSASGGQDPATSPSAAWRTSACRARCAISRPSHPTPTRRDVRERPFSMRRDGRKSPPDLPDGAREFFFTEDLDRANQLGIARQIGRCALETGQTRRVAKALACPRVLHDCRAACPPSASRLMRMVGTARNGSSAALTASRTFAHPASQRPRPLNAAPPSPSSTGGRRGSARPNWSGGRSRGIPTCRPWTARRCRGCRSRCRPTGRSNRRRPDCSGRA